MEWKRLYIHSVYNILKFIRVLGSVFSIYQHTSVKVGSTIGEKQNGLLCFWRFVVHTLFYFDLTYFKMYF